MSSYQLYLVHVLLSLLFPCPATFMFGFITGALLEAIGQNMISRI